MYAFVEVYDGQQWQLGHALELDPDADTEQLIPHNIAPPWSFGNILFYYELSGESGLPTDLSNALRDYIKRDWDNDVYAASWMTLREIKAHLAAAQEDDEFVHFNPDWFLKFSHLSDHHIRVVFWHD